MPEKLFTYFGNKQRIANLVWKLFGTDNRAYAEPFCGSASILLHSPVKHTFEVINDFDCYVANAFRSVKYCPEEVASHLYNPRCEIDLWSRHDYLINHKKDFTQEMLREDPTFCDPLLAAWWIWGQNLWIGSNFCSPDCLLTKCKPLHRNQGVLSTKSQKPVAHNQGVLSWSQKPTNVNKGVLSTKSQKPVIGNKGVLSLKSHTFSQKPLHRNVGVLSLTNEEQSHAQKLFDRVHSVFERLIDTTILCGDWTRALTHSYTTSFGKCAIFLDPPYPGDYPIYENESLEGKLFRDVIQYFLKNYHNPDMRIILCGQDSFWQDCPEDIHKIYWKRSAGYAKDKSNRDEVLWCSDACLFDNIDSNIDSNIIGG